MVNLLAVPDDGRRSKPLVISHSFTLKRWVEVVGNLASRLVAMKATRSPFRADVKNSGPVCFWGWVLGNFFAFPVSSVDSRLASWTASDFGRYVNILNTWTARPFAASLIGHLYPALFQLLRIKTGLVVEKNDRKPGRFRGRLVARERTTSKFVFFNHCFDPQRQSSAFGRWWLASARKFEFFLRRADEQ